MYEICDEKTTIFHRLSDIFCRFFLDPGIFDRSRNAKTCDWASMWPFDCQWFSLYLNWICFILSFLNLNFDHSPSFFLTFGYLIFVGHAVILQSERRISIQLKTSLTCIQYTNSSNGHSNFMLIGINLLSCEVNITCEVIIIWSWISCNKLQHKSCLTNKQYRGWEWRHTPHLE